MPKDVTVLKAMGGVECVRSLPPGEGRVSVFSASARFRVAGSLCVHILRQFAFQSSLARVGSAYSRHQSQGRDKGNGRIGNTQAVGSFCCVSSGISGQSVVSEVE